MTTERPTEIYIGLMSGTSLDGIDIAIVDFTDSQPMVLFTETCPYDPSTKIRIRNITRDKTASIDALCQLGIELGKVFATVVNRSLAKKQLDFSQVQAIGSHGQTIRHCPDAPFPYTLQSGDPNTLAIETGITTIADFRGKDIALGGQGAPLAPAFHRSVFASPTINRAIINIGGIANLTYLPCDPSENVIGFDTGPGNTFIDYWIGLHNNLTFDDCGQWARSGQVIDELLNEILKGEPYFKLPTPKSTGTDYFNADWLSNFGCDNYSPNDVQATLLELTAVSIANCVSQLPNPLPECFICGGGARNLFLVERIQHLIPKSTIRTTDHLKIDPDYVEAMAFAWLAKQRINGLPGNIPSSTNASRQGILGGIYSAN
jgi:anhydro-N-acetylmuramic acid kinase